MDKRQFLIGRHINAFQGFLTAPEFASKIGCTIFQCFLSNPSKATSKPRDEKELKLFAKQLDKYDMNLVIHGSYIINLCQPSNSFKKKSGLKSLINDLNSVSIIGNRVIGVIIHMGKNVEELKQSDEKAMSNYVDGLKQALKQTPKETIIILETGAGQGHEIGSKLEDLSKIYHSLTKSEQLRVKFCIDSCHVHSADYCLSDKKSVDKFFELWDKLIGIDNIICIHFNDSETDCGSHVDRHADLTYGFIGEQGLETIAKYAEKHKIPLIMETPLDAINIKTNQEITVADEMRRVKNWIK